ncbi:MAG: methionyl-tRNA formyltransferase [Deltaproteobacteria bacterium]|nr:methionyl-tRNA formyltransferase [Deltaproteobacteria bacterium]MBW2116686.1 methionyl-tRNA formyltransferase [Deltaproteobacteria bacterium]MBW2342994.1 methionyl-tRNA formyltransferase [Deltaproteobacteria bacterium]
MKYRAIVFGCQQIAVDCIETLLKKGVDIPRIITYELPLDKVYGYKSVQEFALQQNIACDMPKQLTHDFISEIGTLKPDLIFSFYYRKIFPHKLIAIPNLGVVNIHPSYLPTYRGCVPTAWALLNGEKETGITIHYIDGNIDTADIIAQKKISIRDDDTGFSLYNRCMDMGAELFEEVVDDILAGTAPRIQQPVNGSYYGALTDQQNRIDWSTPARRIVNQIRVFSKPYAGVECKFLNKHLVIWRARLGSSNGYLLQGPGKILDLIPAKRTEIVVSGVDDVIVLEDYDIFPPLDDIERDVYLKIGQKIQ